MIKIESILKVMDNSGGLNVKCIRIYGGSVVKSGGIGDIILVSLRKVTPKCKIKTKVCKGVITALKKWVKRKNGHYIRSDQNGIILLKDLENTEGNIIFGPIFSEVFFKGKTKVGSISKDLI
jgi:large subunit ribosomal protein L14